METMETKATPQKPDDNAATPAPATPTPAAGASDTPATGEEKLWYALYVTTGFEKNAYDNLLERIERNAMQGWFGEVLLPLEKRIEIRRGQRKEKEDKMFPGYLFVEMQLTPEVWHMVRGTRWVNGFIGGSQEDPTPLSLAEINAIRNRIDSGMDKPTMRAKFIEGESVRIKDGPFSDFSGFAESVNAERERLVVSVMVFGRSTPVELDFEQVEKI